MLKKGVACDIPGPVSRLRAGARVLSVLSILFFVTAAGAATPSAASYETRNLGWACAGGGGVCTGALDGVTYANRGAFGQAGGVAASTGSGSTNLGGFLQAVDLKRPALDTDGDGLADELDGDNDNDTLGDRLELGGLAFNPTTATDIHLADTDGDGMSDDGEQVAGTDPTQAASLLRITGIKRAPDARIALEWTARADSAKRYRILVSDGPGFTPPSTSIRTNQFAGGEAPWFAMAVAVTNDGPSSNRYFAVQALP